MFSSNVNCQSTQVVAKAGLEPWTDCTKGHTAASVPQLMSKAVKKSVIDLHTNRGYRYRANNYKQ